MRHTVTFKMVADNQTEITVTEYGWTIGHLLELSEIGLNQCRDKVVARLCRG
jgi:hypothetical protein